MIISSNIWYADWDMNSNMIDNTMSRISKTSKNSKQIMKRNCSTTSIDSSWLDYSTLSLLYRYHLIIRWNSQEAFKTKLTKIEITKNFYFFLQWMKYEHCLWLRHSTTTIKRRSYWWLYKLSLFSLLFFNVQVV